MLDGILQEVIQKMQVHLSAEQLSILQDTLYIGFKGKKIADETYELAVCDTGNEAKVRMFAGSKLTTGRKAGTVRQYVREINSVVAQVGKKIEDITAMDIRCYYAERRNSISMATMQTRLHYLGSFWDWMTSEGLVNHNPIRQIGGVLVEQVIKLPFSDEEMEKIRNACQSVRNRALIEFLYSTGVRVSELVALNIEDVDLDKCQIIVTGKGSKQRPVYLTATARYWLKQYLMNRKDVSAECPLFTAEIAPFGRLGVQGIQFMLKQIGAVAGVKHTHPHRFRRTLATNLLNRGMRLEEVKELLGHAKVETTLIYSLVKQENVRHSFLKCA